MPQAIPIRRILIVDDSKEDRSAVCRLLSLDSTSDYQIVEAHTGAEGLEIARTSHFDCLLLDHRLPDCNSLEFLRELSNQFDGETLIAVVLMTGQADEDLVVEVLKRGAQDYLVKGRFTSEVLRRSINYAVLRVETRRELDRSHRAAREAIRLKDEVLAQQAATEARLRHQLALTETVANTTTEGLCMVDRQGRFTFVNPAAETILGGSQADLLGTALVDFLSSFDWAMSRDGVIWETAISSTSTIRNRETVWPRHGGPPIPVAFSSAPIVADGEMVGTIVAVRDITEQRRIAAEMEQKTIELIEAGRKKDEFLAMLAHELRNPLAPILNAMRIIGLRGGNDPAQERIRAMVEQQVRHMNRLIDDLLDLSRIARGTIQLRREPTLLRAAVDRAVESIRHQVEARGQALEVEIPTESIWLDVDPTRFDQILSNLLTNAAKYTDPNGQIRLTASQAGGDVELRVVDTGVGIAADFLPMIFELFSQADRSLDRSQGGLGIGLTLVHDLVERHGGSISVRSDGLGMGSEFIVRLPTVSEVVVAAVELDAPETLVMSRPIRILVVDDNVHAAQSLAVVLQLWGHDVMVAHDGPSAIDSAPIYRPEVVLLDIGLPEMDGYRVAEEIQKISLLSHTTILAMTGYAAAEDRRRSARAGFKLHLVKPLDLDALELYLNEFGRSTAVDGKPVPQTSTTDGSR